MATTTSLALRRENAVKRITAALVVLLGRTGKELDLAFLRPAARSAELGYALQLEAIADALAVAMASVPEAPQKPQKPGKRS